jgi:hypothetical protein
MHTIFVGGIATGRFAMGSNEPLGTASPAGEYGTDSQGSDTIIIDGSDKPFLAPPARGKRKRGALAEDELMAFSSMTEAVKDITQAIRENKPTDIHPELYKAIMDVLEYFLDALMAALTTLSTTRPRASSVLTWQTPTGPSGSRTTCPRTTSICSACPRALWCWGDMHACL